MNILFLAPQPFYQERGTPIAVDMMLRVLSERGDHIDLIAYHEGDPVEYDNVTLNRIPNIPFVKGVPPGFSWKKLVCDTFMIGKAIRFSFSRKYQMVHAVEEAALIALVLKWVFRIPYVYDMDSSFAQQMTEKYPGLKFAGAILNFLEKQAVKNAMAVVPVCDALADVAESHEPNKKVVVLHDISLLKAGNGSETEHLRATLGITGPVIMYVGNLEEYQGIDLLLHSFQLALQEEALADLVIVGGKPSDVEKYQALAGELGIERKVHLIGPRPVEKLAEYLDQADVLVSPRTKGQNTPMKLYSYLHSGKAVLATNLPTHTQVLNDDVAMLKGATSEEFSKGIIQLVEDTELRAKLGLSAQQLIESRHTFRVFKRKLNDLYDWLQVRPEGAVTS